MPPPLPVFLLSRRVHEDCQSTSANSGPQEGGPCGNYGCKLSCFCSGHKSYLFPLLSGWRGHSDTAAESPAESNQNGGEDRPFYDHTLRNWSCKGIFSGSVRIGRAACSCCLSPCVVPIVHGPSTNLTTPQETCKTGEAGAVGRGGGRRAQPKGGRRA